MIYGVNPVEQRFLYLAGNDVNVIGFISPRKKTVSKILEKPVMNLNLYCDCKKNKVFAEHVIVVVDPAKAYDLQKKGFKFSVDFVFPFMLSPRLEQLYNFMDYYGFLSGSSDNSLEKNGFDRKICILFGNCQMYAIKKALDSCAEFKETYNTIYLSVCDPTTKDKILFFYNHNLLKKCPLLITQEIADDNKFGTFFSLNNILTYFPKTVEVIKIPSIWFGGYFPQHTNQIFKVIKTPSQPGGLYPYGDRYLNQLYKSGKTNTKILELIKQPDFISKESVLENVDATIDDLRKREQSLDIEISDYITDNYKKQLLFYSCNHPCRNVIDEISGRILKYINISNWSVLLGERTTLQGQDELIYPSVIEALELPKSLYNTIYYSNFYLFPNPLTFDEYVLGYLNALRDTGINL